MRYARELDILRPLKYRPTGVTEPFDVGDGSIVDLGAPCTVIGGRNGAGKSRLLRRIADACGAKAVMIDLHYLVEHALVVLRSRDDIDAMADENDSIGPDADRLDDVERVVRRTYESVEWFALEIDPADKVVADRFRWTNDQPLVPYFRVSYRGRRYTSAEMGLGEFAVHYLLWILEHFSEERGLTIVLDEPDSYLPPVGTAALLPRLLRICQLGNGAWCLALIQKR